MSLLICMAAGLLAGIGFGGWTALRHARRHDLESATKSLRWGSLAAAGFAMACTTLTLGWPMKESEITVTEEVTRTVVETIQVPVRTSRWLVFWRTEIVEQEISKEITETEVRGESVRTFSAWMLIPMAGVGLIGSWVYRWGIRMVWRRFS